MALGSTQPLTEMSTRLFPGGKVGRCVRLTTLPPSCAVVMKYGNLNFLEPSGPIQACNGTALPFTSHQHISVDDFGWRVNRIKLLISLFPQDRCILNFDLWGGATPPSVRPCHRLTKDCRDFSYVSPTHAEILPHLKSGHNIFLCHSIHRAFRKHARPCSPRYSRHCEINKLMRWIKRVSLSFRYGSNC